MKVLLTGIVAALAAACLAALVLYPVRSPSYEAYSTTSVRVGDPGSNLVGENWSSQPASRS
jgi:uncharacterized protein involved in exopolysaccharide biosynthesis